MNRDFISSLIAGAAGILTQEILGTKGLVGLATVVIVFFLVRLFIDYTLLNEKTGSEILKKRKAIGMIIFIILVAILAYVRTMKHFAFYY